MPRPPGSSKARSKQKQRRLTENEKKSFQEKLATCENIGGHQKEECTKVLKPEVLVQEGSDLLLDDGARS
eukprot:scaffold53218_cov31-Attheya_sp.AAC.2